MIFKDKVVIVTGAGRGIGQAIAVKYARSGALVVVVDRQLDRAKETVKMISKMGERAIAVVSDITVYEEAQKMLAVTLNEFGGIDILVNNAGWDVVQPFFENTKELLVNLIAVNLKGCIYCCRVVGEEMIKNKKGKIVNISSDAGRIGSSEEAVYAAAKGGIIAFTKSLAVILAPYQINVNSISPGPTDTPAVRTGMRMNEKVAIEMERRRDMTPFKRYAKAEEVADAVLFLSSESANFITGQILSVNGGAIMVD